MKKLYLPLFTILISLLLASCGSQPTSQNQNASQTARSSAQEFDLDLSNTILPYPDYLQQSDSFINYFKTTNVFLTVQIDSVNYSTLKMLSDSLSGMTSDYITGFRMAYTLDDSDQIRLYYIPTYAQYTGETNKKKIFSFNISDPDLDSIIKYQPRQIYIARAGSLVSIDTANNGLNNARNNYKQYKSLMKIFDPRANAFRKFQYGIDATSSFIPTQEIDSLAYDNGSSGQPASMIYFTSTTKLKDGSYAHQISLASFLSSKGGDQNLPGFKNKAANFSQMSPPRGPDLRIFNNSLSD